MNSALLDPHLKMFASPRNSHILKLAVIACSLIFTVYYLFSGTQRTSNIDYKELYNTALSGKKKVFVDKFLANDIDGPFDNSTIVELCRTRQWTPGLIFSCESPDGGVGNVRNVVLNCVRYAIEAGATGFVIPEITIQTSKEQAAPVPFTHFFDTAYFAQALSSSCPQMKVYGHVNDLYDLPTTSKSIPLEPSKLTNTFIADTVIAAPSTWRADFEVWLNASHPTRFTAAAPIHVKISKSLLEFPLSYDPPHFISTFGRILRFRLDTRTLAASILYALSTQHKLGLTPKIQAYKFYGAHLRTGADAKTAGWTPCEIQADNYITGASHLSLDIIYLVSGNRNDMAAFSLQAVNQSIYTTDKELLLGGQEGNGAKGFEREWAQLRSLSWDQRLLVDYEVLLRSSSFGGTWESSLSWNVAMRRHVVNGDGEWKGLEAEGEVVKEKSIKAPAPATPPAPEGPNIVKLNGGRSRIEGRSPVQTEVELFVSSGTMVEKRQTPDPASASAAPRPDKVLVPNAKVGDTSFRDGMSVVYGPMGEGRRIVISMWP